MLVFDHWSQRKRRETGCLRADTTRYGVSFIMTASPVGELALAFALLLTAFGVSLAALPAADASPNDLAVPGTPEPGTVVAGSSAAADANPASAAACSQFANALDSAAVNYSDFAAGMSSPDWNYANPTVRSANVAGRTALREAARAALSASDTPGLQSDVAAPIRVWSTRAAKLLVNMFLHRSNDAVDTAATELNEATYNVQMACAKAGTPAVTS